MRRFLYLLFKLLYRIELNIDPRSKMIEGIIICNHQSFLDGILLGLYLPQRPLFVIDRRIAARWYFRPLLRFVSHLTVDPRHPMAIKQLLQHVEKGKSVVIFPEGRITITGSFMKFYEGAAFIAQKSGRPLIPVYIDGAQLSYFSRLKGVIKQRAFPKITIDVDAPHYLSDKQKSTTDNDVDNRKNNRKRRLSHHELANKTQEILMNTRLHTFQPTSLFATLLSAREQFGKKTAVLEDIERKALNYQQIITYSLLFSRLFSRITEEKERIGLMLPNSSAAAISLFALNAIGRTAAMINYTSGLESIQTSLIAADIQQIITSKRFLKEAKLEGIVAALPHIQWHYLEELKPQITFKDKLWALWARRNPLRQLPKVDADAEAAIIFTSGSEGIPKGVVHSNRSLLTNVKQLHTVADFSPKDTFMVTLPLFHAFGLTVGLLTSLFSGAKAFLYPSPLHYRIIPELIYETQATVLFGTSTFLQNYARYAHPLDFSSLRYVVAGAEKLNEHVKESWLEKFGIRILEGYGASECAPVISINLPSNYKADRLGKLLPGMEAKLLPIEGIATGGKLLVKGGNIMKGYLFADQPGVLSTTYLDNHNGWYDTGDIVTIDEEGFLKIEGRVKRFAKIAGEMVSLETTERLFHEAYPDFQHAAVIRKDDKKGEAIVIFTTIPGDPDRKALAETARLLGLPELAISRDYRYLPELPRLGSGKVNYQALNELIEKRSIEEASI